MAGDADSNTVTIVVEASEPELATRAADALAEAYEEILAERNRDTISAAFADVAMLLENLDAEIESVTEELNAILGQDEEYQELLVQYEEALATFNELRDRRSGLDPGSIERTAINEQIAELLRDFTTWQVIFDTERSDQRVNLLLADREALVAERSRLTAQRNAISAASSAGLGGVVLRSPATEPEDPAGPGRPILVALAVVLGGGLAVIAANAIETNRDDLSASRHVLADLDSPMLTMLPAPDPETPLPCLDDPTSAEANRFRYAATALDIRAAAAGARSILVVGLRAGDGATAAAANIGVSLADAGLRVLMIDADLTTQSLVKLLGPELVTGLNDVLAGDVTLSEAVSEIYVTSPGSLSVLGRGTPGSGIASVRTDMTHPMIGQAAKTFDLVVIDTAPLLDSAYVATLAREVDGLALVFSEATRHAEVEEAIRRLELIETPVLGYFIAERRTGRRAVSAFGGLRPSRLEEGP